MAKKYFLLIIVTLLVFSPVALFAGGSQQVAQIKEAFDYADRLQKELDAELGEGVITVNSVELLREGPADFGEIDASGFWTAFFDIKVRFDNDEMHEAFGFSSLACHKIVVTDNQTRRDFQMVKVLKDDIQKVLVKKLLGKLDQKSETDPQLLLLIKRYKYSIGGDLYQNQ